MKIILSRKGFDSQYGGKPSLRIGNDLISFPIPEEGTGVGYGLLKYAEDTYEKILAELGYDQGIMTCHLDPDIFSNSPRAIFGQSDAAARHLLMEADGVPRVNRGDVFLFFGTFREGIKENGKYSYSKGAKEKHIIYGYLQIGEVVNRQFDKYPWHPHAKEKYTSDPQKNNRMFIASEKLICDDGTETSLPGYGVLKYSEDLVLTKGDESKSKWKLPPNAITIKSMTYHNMAKLLNNNDYFQSVYRGQEFIIDSDIDSKKLVEWLSKHIK